MAAGASDPSSGDVGGAPSAWPPSGVAGGVLGAVDAHLSTAAGQFLTEEWKERLRDVIRIAAGREEAIRAERARRATQLVDQLREVVALE